MFHLLPQGIDQPFTIGPRFAVAAPGQQALAQATQFFAQLLVALMGPRSFARPALPLLPAFVQLVPQAIQVTLQPMQLVVQAILVAAPGIVRHAVAWLVARWLARIMAHAFQVIA